MKTRSTIADRYTNKRAAVLVLSIPLLFATAVFADEKDLGNLSENPYALNSTANPYGKNNQHGDGIGNPSGQYGSLYSNKSATNPFTADAPKPYDQQGQYRDRLSVSPYALDSTRNPYGRYGSQYGNALSNPFVSGSPYGDGLKNP
jgi:hypothetical protein